MVLIAWFISLAMRTLVLQSPFVNASNDIQGSCNCVPVPASALLSSWVGVWLWHVESGIQASLVVPLLTATVEQQQQHTTSKRRTKLRGQRDLIVLYFIWPQLTHMRFVIRRCTVILHRCTVQVSNDVTLCYFVILFQTSKMYSTTWTFVSWHR